MECTRSPTPTNQARVGIYDCDFHAWPAGGRDHIQTIHFFYEFTMGQNLLITNRFSVHLARITSHGFQESDELCGSPRVMRGRPFPSSACLTQSVCPSKFPPFCTPDSYGISKVFRNSGELGNVQPPCAAAGRRLGRHRRRDCIQHLRSLLLWNCVQCLCKDGV